jgi:hypothetical protein
MVVRARLPNREGTQGRHAAPDPVMVLLGGAWIVSAGVLVALLGSLAGQPCPCDPVATARSPVSAPDLPLNA